MIVRNVPQISFIAAPVFLGSKKATTIVTRGETDRFIQILTKNLEGLRDGKMISYKQFSELRIPVPSPEEQKKIADCLSSLDELIAAQARKVDALKTHKKGLMQQL